MFCNPAQQKNRCGFTILELVAVLLIFAVLAVVAVPRYLAMQSQAATRALGGATAAMASQVYVDYVYAIMASPSVANQWTGNATMTRVTVGDFVGSYTIDSGSVTLAVIGGATEKGSDVYEFASELSNFSAYTSQKFQLYSQE